MSSFCKKCGTWMAGDTCTKCQTTGVNLADRNATTHCSGCGKLVSLSVAYCPDCGKETNVKALSAVSGKVTPQWVNPKTDKVARTHCPHCNKLINVNDRICPGCEKDVTKNYEFISCPHCEAEIDADSKLCSKCGKAVAETKAEVKKQDKHCPRCGKLMNGLTVCPRCGHGAPKMGDIAKMKAMKNLSTMEIIQAVLWICAALTQGATALIFGLFAFFVNTWFFIPFICYLVTTIFQCVYAVKGFMFASQIKNSEPCALGYEYEVSLGQCIRLLVVNLLLGGFFGVAAAILALCARNYAVKKLIA